VSVYCTVGLDGYLEDVTEKMRLEEPLVCGNQRAHAFQYTVYADEDKTPADLTGVTCAGRFLRLDNGTAVEPITGTVSGNVCTVILPADCYSTPCRYRFTMDVTSGNDHRTLMWVEGTVEQRNSSTIITP